MQLILTIYKKNELGGDKTPQLPTTKELCSRKIILKNTKEDGATCPKAPSQNATFKIGCTTLASHPDRQARSSQKQPLHLQQQYLQQLKSSTLCMKVLARLTQYRDIIFRLQGLCIELLARTCHKVK